MINSSIRVSYSTTNKIRVVYVIIRKGHISAEMSNMIILGALYR